MTRRNTDQTQLPLGFKIFLVIACISLLHYFLIDRPERLRIIKLEARTRCVERGGIYSESFGYECIKDQRAFSWSDGEWVSTDKTVL